MKKLFWILMAGLSIGMAQAQVTSVSILGKTPSCGSSSVAVTIRVVDAGDGGTIHYDILFGTSSTVSSISYSSWKGGYMSCISDVGYTQADNGVAAVTIVKSVTYPGYSYNGYLIVIAEEGTPFLSCSSTAANTAFHPCSTPTKTPTYTPTYTLTATPTFTPTATSCFSTSCSGVSWTNGTDSCIYGHTAFLWSNGTNLININGTASTITSPNLTFPVTALMIGSFTAPAATTLTGPIVVANASPTPGPVAGLTGNVTVDAGIAATPVIYHYANGLLVGHTP